MDAAKHSRTRPYFRSGAGLLLVLCAALAFQVPAKAQQAAATVITGLQLRKEGDRLELHFQTSRPTPFLIIGNPVRQVVVVKFPQALPAFRDNQRYFVFNDPYLVGLAFEDISEGGTWAKIRLRTSRLDYKAGSPSPSNQVVLSFSPRTGPLMSELLDVKLQREGNASRVLLELSSIPPFVEQPESNVFILRMRSVNSRLTRPPRASDEQVALGAVERDGEDTLVSVVLKQPNLRANVFTMPERSRIVVDFRPMGPLPEAQETKSPAKAAAKSNGPVAPGPKDPVELLLELEENPLIRANYLLGESELRGGNYQRAADVFLRVFDSSTKSRLGVRAYQRAADALFELRVSQGAKNFHDVIVTYQSAIRAAENIGYESDLIPRAFFQIGRSYQQMGFSSESNVHYEILQKKFPQSVPYAADSYFYQGLNHLAAKKSEEAVAAFQRFFSEGGDKELQGPAYYYMGDAYYQMKRFVDARVQFDQGRKVAPFFTDDKPLLIFHMGETYYENADFQQSLAYYQVLLDRFPDKSYSKLVALRVGDFLRDEGRQEEALAVYQRVTGSGPPEVRFRAKIRIADMLAQRPTGDDYRRAVMLYDEVIKEGEADVVAQEAMLRKALTLQLHGLNQEALQQLEQLSEKFPSGPFNRENLLLANIEENLKSLMDRYFQAGSHWEAAKLYTQYKDKYFRNFRFPTTLFQVGQAYQKLGLFKEATNLYDEILASKAAPELKTLVVMQKARAALEKDDLGAAEKILLEFIKSRKEDPYLPDAQMLLGAVYEAGRRYEDAINTYTILVQNFERTHDPGLGEVLAEAHFQIARIQKELGRFQEALTHYRQVGNTFNHPVQGALVPEFIPLSQFHIGDMQYELQEDKEAIAAYEEALKRYPDHERAPWAQYQIGLIYRRGAEDRKALEVFNALVERAKVKPGEMWETLARQNQRELANKLKYKNYLEQ